MFRAWQSVQENKWKERVERACQNRAQEVCEQLTRDYEEKIAQFQRQLGHAHAEIASMRADRDQFEERMKKGFMRGVCALNLEAMTMFKEDEATKENIEPQLDVPIMQVHLLYILIFPVFYVKTAFFKLSVRAHNFYTKQSITAHTI